MKLKKGHYYEVITSSTGDFDIIQVLDINDDGECYIRNLYNNRCAFATNGFDGTPYFFSLNSVASRKAKEISEDEALVWCI